MIKRKAKVSDEDSSCSVDKDLRTIYISGDITRKLSSRFRKIFRSMQHESSEPIVVEINSPGGDVDAGHMIVDTILLSNNCVITRVTGEASSMGAMILAAGDLRQALPRSTIMVHAIRWRLDVTETQLKTEIDSIENTNTTFWDLIDSQTEQDAGYWKTLCGGMDKYLTPREALKHNLIHEICENN